MDEEEEKELIKISKIELNELPLIIFDGKIHCVRSDKDISYALKTLKKSKVIGFDTETRPNFKKGVSNSNKVALLQLATLNDAFLFKLHDVKLIEDIFAILSDKKIVKIGAAVHDDIKALNKLKPFTPNNFVDLQKIVEQYGIGDKSLRKLTGIILKQRLSKTQQLSNWEREELDVGQQNYAATDAWVCVRIYNELKKLKKVEQPKNKK